MIRLGRETDRKFRWKEDLGFSRSMLSDSFLHYKKMIEFQVRWNKILVNPRAIHLLFHQ